MAYAVADRVREQVSAFAGGTGAVTLPGVAVSGCQTFLSGWAASGTGEYCLTMGSQWETGFGTLNAGGTSLTRTTVYHGSSGAGVAVNFSAGVLDCFGDIPAYVISRMVRGDRATSLTAAEQNQARVNIGAIGLPIPQGRPSLATATPVHTADVPTATTIYWCLYGGSLYPWYDGTQWTIRSIAELSIALDSNSGHTGYHQSGKSFDLFLTNDAGIDRLITGPAWTNDTTRSAAISQINGIWVNTGSITARFGSSSGNTITVAASQGTYVASFRATADGQASWIANPGNDTIAKLLLWSCYNRIAVVGTYYNTGNEATSNFSNRPFNNSANARIQIIHGLNEETIEAVASFQYHVTGGAQGFGVVGIGIDSTSASSCLTSSIASGDSGSGDMRVPPRNELTTKQLGYHYFCPLETSNGGNANLSDWKAVVKDRM